MTQAQENPALVQSIGCLSLATFGQGFSDITNDIQDWLKGERAKDGLLNIFISHTSASLLIQENADPDVQRDLQNVLQKLAPEDGRYHHESEGPDDMPAHIKSMLTQTNLTISVQAGHLKLGRWQGIYLIEHRTAPRQRDISLHFLGNKTAT